MCFVQVLGALASVLSVWAVTGVLLWEAALRLKHPQPVNGKGEGMGRVKG